MFLTSHRRNAGFTIRELLAVVAVIAVLMALILPAINSARVSTQKGQCRSNMMQIGLSLATYEEANKGFPTLYFRKIIKAEQGKEQGTNVSFNADPTLADQEYSWMVNILPYMEEKNVYDQISLGSGVFSNDPSSVKIVNAEGKQTSASNWESYFIRCPTFRGNIEKYSGTTNYVALTATKQQLLTVGKDNPTLADGVLVPSDARNYRGLSVGTIKDGISKTIMIAESVEEERSNWLHWQQVLVCGFLPGDTSVTNNDPSTGVPRVEQDRTWVFNKNAGDRTALNFGPRSSSPNQQPYNTMPNDPLRRKFGPSSNHIGDVVMHGLADASIREVASTDIDPKVYYSAITRDGNEGYDFEE
jgi:prepilin-type N-terminal cleavage/methylation domain-containing protein